MTSNMKDFNWSAWSPTEMAVLCFVVKGDSLLLIEKLRGLGAGKVNAPGGRLEPGETPEEAAVRELQEEVSVTPHDLMRVGNLRFAFVDGLRLECWVFRAESHTGEPQNSDEAIPFWNSVTNLPYDRMWVDDRQWLPHLLERRLFEGRFVFEGDTMLSGSVNLVDTFSS